MQRENRRERAAECGSTSQREIDCEWVRQMQMPNWVESNGSRDVLDCRRRPHSSCAPCRRGTQHQPPPPPFVACAHAWLTFRVLKQRSIYNRRVSGADRPHLRQRLCPLYPRPSPPLSALSRLPCPSAYYNEIMHTKHCPYIKQGAAY